MPDVRLPRGLSGPAALVALVSLVISAACGPSAEKIHAWKTRRQGPDKLVKTVKDPRVDAALRGQAVAALVEIGLAQDMEAAVAGLDIEARTALVRPAVVALAPLVNGANRGQAGEARVALYTLREQTGAAEARNAIDAVLFPALVADVKAARERVGRLAVKDMLIGIGVAIVPRLLPLLGETNVPFPTPVEVIDKVGDLEAKDRAAQGLVNRARALTGAGAPLPQALPDALATMGGQVAAEYLMGLVDKQTAPDAERAAVALAKIHRAKGVASFAVRKAGNPTTPAPLRERLYEVAEQHHGEEARAALVALIGSSPEAATRYRAFRALLKSAGGGGLLAGLEAFPQSATYTSEDVREHLVTPISAMPGFDTRPPMFKALESGSPLARLVALLIIEYMGFGSDAAHVAKLEKDRGLVRGLPPSDAVGRQATRIAAALKKKAS